MAGKSGDGVVYVALVLSALAAILSAPADASVAHQILRGLLMQAATIEAMTKTRAVNGPTTFAVPP